MEDAKDYEVIVIGGSYAGLSAAMALGRSLRKVLIIDSGLRCNRQTPHSHNFLTQDGERPGVIADKARAEVLKYPTVKLINDIAISGSKSENGFVIGTKSGQQFSSQKLIMASGIMDIMPDIKGFLECWGISVVHCPYCHGYEIAKQKTAILANGARAIHLASLVNNLTNDLTILTNGKADFNEEELQKLNSHQIKIVETGLSEILHQDGQLETLIFEDGSTEHFSALYAAVKFTQHSNIPVSLGCELTEHGHIQVNNFQATTVKGIYACGDNSTMLRAVASAVYSGNLAGAMVNKELTDDQF
ncbi:MAG: NAD(P)/FAD-dependent oxidoreductase [Pedobacter sp.]